MDDREFVERLRREDAAAVRHLSECLLPSVWRFVYFRVKGDQHLAEDIVSETVLALIKTIAQSEVEVVCPSAWMRSVATHKVQDHFRAVARVQHLIDQTASDIKQNQNTRPDCEEEAKEQRATVRKVMDDLPEQHRLALEWKYIDHLSVHDIALRMATTEKAVESILYRARREFREALGVVHRDDVPFRLNGDTKSLNGGGSRSGNGPAGVSGRTSNGVPAIVEPQQPAGFDELKQR